MTFQEYQKQKKALTEAAMRKAAKGDMHAINVGKARLLGLKEHFKATKE